LIKESLRLVIVILTKLHCMHLENGQAVSFGLDISINM